MRIEKTYSTEAVTFVPNPPGAGNWLANPENIAPDQRELALYLAQLEEEGFATHADGHKVAIIWEDLYRLLAHPAHESSLPLLHLPSEARIRPRLTSQGALDDADFGIFLDGWTNEMGNPLAGMAERIGGLMRFPGTDQLLLEDTWRLLEKIRAFADMPESDKTRDRNFREWGRIRALAKRAHAKLDQFLEDTLVLTPERLRLDLRKSEVGGSAVVEVTPTFDGAPDRWLEVFDHGRNVLSRYDITTNNGGIVHVVVEPAVQCVLAQIKRMPHRRAAGIQAEAFLRNPYALLGEETEGVVPPEDFEATRAAAGIGFYGFSLEPVRDSGQITHVELVIFPIGSEDFLEESRLTLATADSLRAFLNNAKTTLMSGRPCFVWESRTLEMDVSVVLHSCKNLFARRYSNSLLQTSVETCRESCCQDCAVERRA